MICIYRPEQFSDTSTSSVKTQHSIPDDMLPPSDTESDTTDTDDIDLVCNPNRQERLHAADSAEDSDNSNNSDTEQKWT